MPAITVNLTQDELARVRRLADGQGQPIETVIHAAVTAYLSRPVFDEAAWRQRLGAFLAEVHRDLPAGISPEEIEADITAARDEVRQAHRAARRD